MLSKEQIFQIREFNRHYTQALGILNKNIFNMNLTWPEGRILIEIGLNKYATPMAIANNLQMDKSYTSRIINNLVKKDIVTKRPSPEDKRSVQIQLTDHGTQVFNEVNENSNKQVNNLLDHLSASQKEKYFNDIMEINQLIFGGTKNDMED
ncbi:MarR family winged helix-turn-helix transcriptional regulator [uncultured Lactobacillus sp.]|uniref:MarR family winged helix-turn-helix transcriptional regulator n=1 Tax=uncultured Lactobacillus sp. TaxID=153152 RepID=UPI0028063CCC|nr:MarR family winged helix-turn-helix transcriptional regulator [uncultured Lactobacillus sp.]